MSTGIVSRAMFVFQQCAGFAEAVHSHFAYLLLTQAESA